MNSITKTLQLRICWIIKRGRFLQKTVVLKAFPSAAYTPVGAQQPHYALHSDKNIPPLLVYPHRRRYRQPHLHFRHSLIMSSTHPQKSAVVDGAYTCDARSPACVTLYLPQKITC